MFFVKLELQRQFCTVNCNTLLPTLSNVTEYGPPLLPLFTVPSAKFQVYTVVPVSGAIPLKRIVTGSPLQILSVSIPMDATTSSISNLVAEALEGQPLTVATTE